MKRNDIFGLVALTVCLGGVLALVLLAPQQETKIYGPIEVPGSALSIKAGQKAGAQTVTASATIAQGGFVTVHRAVGEAPADIIGMSEFLSPGDYPDLTISLAEPTEAASTYYLLMFADDGDGVYVKGVDLPVEVNGVVLKEKLAL